MAAATLSEIMSTLIFHFHNSLYLKTLQLGLKQLIKQLV